jgi:hypothetical protein
VKGELHSEKTVGGLLHPVPLNHLRRGTAHSH